MLITGDTLTVHAARHKPTSADPLAPDPPAATASEPSDESLLDRMRSRDTAALDALVGRWSRVLMRTAWLTLGDAHAADDAVQQTFIAAWDGARRTTPQTPVRGWLFAILINQCRRRQRSAGRRRRREEAAARPERVEPGPHTDTEIELERMRRALLRLTPPLREVVVLRFQQGLSVDDTAAALGIAEGTVKSRTHSAMAELRRRLTGETP
ncbi:MAG: RNA polymerase sigma factor [Planctomycetota bacterium]